MISLLQNQASGNGGAADGAAAAAMPPPAPVGLFQTPSSAGPTAARSPVPEGETPFSSIRQYLQKTNAERRRVPLSLPNARGAMRPGASVGLGSGSRPALGGAPSTGFRSLYAASDAPQQPSLLGMNGPRGAGGFGTTRGVGYGGPGSPPTASGTGMDWRSPGAGKGLLSPGMKRSRDMAEFDLHERESGRSTVQRVFGPGEVAGTPAVPAVPKATPAKASTGGKEPAASAVTTDTARRILQTLDRLAGQKPGSDADAVIASPAAKPLNLSSSLNKAAAPTSSLHGFRGIQRATPAKSLASAEKRSPASFIASHSKPIASAPKPSPLQFQPEASKEQEKPSTVAPAPAVSPSTFAPGSSKSSHGVEAKANKPPPPLFSSATAAKPASSPVPATSTESLPTFSFGGKSDGKPSSPLVPTTAADKLPSYTFGGDDDDMPKYNFGTEDDGEIDAVKFGSGDLDKEVVSIKYTFGEGVYSAHHQHCAHCRASGKEFRTDFLFRGRRDRLCTGTHGCEYPHIST